MNHEIVIGSWREPYIPLDLYMGSIFIPYIQQITKVLVNTHVICFETTLLEGAGKEFLWVKTGSFSPTKTALKTDLKTEVFGKCSSYMSDFWGKYKMQASGSWEVHN